jgi:uncharacterized protein (UPF0332 family)
VKPVEFDQVAALLRSSSGATVEGRERSAISRYYYSAFLEARTKLREKRNFSFRKHEAHEFVKRAFAYSDDKRLKKVGKLLEDLKKLREQADYSIDAPHDPVITGEAETISRRIRTELAAEDFDFGACASPDGRPQP